MSEALLAQEVGTVPVAVPASGARQFWRRLRAQRAAVAAAAVVALLVLAALAAPLLVALEGQDPNTFHPALVDSAAGGAPLGPFGGISAEHWLGVEPQTGRDLFARVVHGARVSLGVALFATVVQVFIGVVIGLAAGLGSRTVDQVLSRITDVNVAMPLMVIALALLAIVPAGFPRPVLIALVVGLIGWAGTSKIVRAQALTLKSLDYVSAARLSGWGNWRIARRELLPSLAAPVITYSALLLPQNIVVEAALSFLGVGIKPPTPSWGQMLTDADVWYQAAPSYLLIPALLLFVTVLALTVLGEGVRTALDPRSRSRLGTARRGFFARRGASGRKTQGDGGSDSGGDGSRDGSRDNSRDNSRDSGSDDSRGGKDGAR